MLLLHLCLADSPKALLLLGVVSTELRLVLAVHTHLMQVRINFRDLFNNTRVLKNTFVISW